MTVTERQKLNVFEMKCLRSMTGVSWLDSVRNEVVRARTGVRRELAARVDMNVLRWFGHVERMDNEQLLKKVMNAKVDGRSARGRPRFGWMDGVKRALNDRMMLQTSSKQEMMFLNTCVKFRHNRLRNEVCRAVTPLGHV